jgi:hypothetical protein
VLEFLTKHIVDAYIVLLLGLQVSMIFPALNWWPHPIKWLSSLQITDKFNLLLLVFTFVLAFSTLGLWLATRNLVLDAENTAERQLRSYIYIGPFDVDLKSNADGSSTVTINPSLRVFGITPAAWVSPAWDLKIVPAWPAGQFPTLPITANRIDLVVVPPQDYHRMGKKDVTLQKIDIQSLENKTKTLLAFGRITYTDVFEKIRWTDFCAAIEWQDAKPNNAALCPGHNAADWTGHAPAMVSSTVLQIRVSPPPKGQQQ